MMKDRRKIMMVAGEASGDQHAAKLVRELRLLMPNDLEFFGAAGEEMRKEGVEAVVRADGLSIVGLLEIGRALPTFIRAFRSLIRAAKEKEPAVAVLVDFPDFNLKLARKLKKLGIPVVYYISPQLWAWRGHRIRSIRKFVDLMILILPFEKEWYADRGVNSVEYVGSPLAREIHPSISKEDFCSKHGIDPQKPIVCFLPGSRHKEIVRILPVMLEASLVLAKSNPDMQFLIALAASRKEHEVNDAISALSAAGRTMPGVLKCIDSETYDALNASDAAAITSGTATLEAAIIGTPMVIVYKTSAINYKLLRPLISVEHFGLVNLIAGKRIARELIQSDLTVESLSSELLRILDAGENAKARVDLAEAAEKLGHGGASKRAAEAIVRTMEISDQSFPGI